MGGTSESGQSISSNQAVNNPKQEAISALCALGYKPQDASKMVQNIPQEDNSCEDIIKLALQGAAGR